jgi:hypothetical protein
MAKHSFEQLAYQHNKFIKCYHIDNGIFASKDFRSSCLQQKQRMKSMISWPDIITEHLWPYALRLAVDLHNNTPTSTGLTPEEIFTGLKGHNRLSDFHTFGCPTGLTPEEILTGLKGHNRLSDFHTFGCPISSFRLKSYSSI